MTTWVAVFSITTGEVYKFSADTEEEIDREVKERLQYLQDKYGYDYNIDCDGVSRECDGLRREKNV